MTVPVADTSCKCGCVCGGVLEFTPITLSQACTICFPCHSLSFVSELLCALDKSSNTLVLAQACREKHSAFAHVHNSKEIFLTFFLFFFFPFFPPSLFFFLFLVSPSLLPPPSSPPPPLFGWPLWLKGLPLPFLVGSSPLPCWLVVSLSLVGWGGLTLLGDSWLGSLPSLVGWGDPLPSFFGAHLLSLPVVWEFPFPVV